MGDEHAGTPTQAPPRERMSWAQLGEASRELARAIVDDGYEPDLILGIARGGLLVAGALSYAIGREEHVHDERRVLHRASTSGCPCR